MAPAPAAAPPIVVLVRVRGGRWREVGTATSYFDALAVAEAAGVPGCLWWFRTSHEAELAEDLPRAS
jgi:hypothetical protein